jgi:hypothetical protein
MAEQREMLEDLGVDGMSSDEEEIIDGRTQYLIVLPEWRNPRVTIWLRIFDGLCLYHRRRVGAVDARGRMPRTRIATTRLSTSKKFVAGLPENAYRRAWLEKQLDVRNVVRPGPFREYEHLPEILL